MEKHTSDILLVGINARYRHTSIGLRCLKANLGVLADRTGIFETTLQQQAGDIVDQILDREPLIVGLGVYIWNTILCTEVVALLKAIRPELIVILGGPEVSYESLSQPIVQAADFTVCGEGEQAFHDLCIKLLNDAPPNDKLIQGTTPAMTDLEFPYALYTDDDIAHRVVYVEASRGCPYKCQFCLSSIDKAVRMVSLDAFFEAMESLIRRGARDFKFIDRTFNLKLSASTAILSFFLERFVPGMSLHFEMVPDRLPEELRGLLAQFPPGAVQLEIGIQTFDPEVSARIQRRQDYEKLRQNLQFLVHHTGVHLHTDLIVGLPGESQASFARGFDQLVQLQPHEIQVGILKRLKGTPIVMHDQSHHMTYNPLPPFDVLKTGALTYSELQEMKRFARYWDLVANSGNFVTSSRLIWHECESPYTEFLAFTRWLFARLQTTHSIALHKLTEGLFVYLSEVRALPLNLVGTKIYADYHNTPNRRTPRFLRPFAVDQHPAPSSASGDGGLKRQQRHLAESRTTKDIEPNEPTRDKSLYSAT